MLSVYFSSDLSSENGVWQHKRDRFYKWEMEVLIAFSGDSQRLDERCQWDFRNSLWTEFHREHMFLKTVLMRQ